MISGGKKGAAHCFLGAAREKFFSQRPNFFHIRLFYGAVHMGPERTWRDRAEEGVAALLGIVTTCYYFAVRFPGEPWGKTESIVRNPLRHKGFSDLYKIALAMGEEISYNTVTICYRNSNRLKT